MLGPAEIWTKLGGWGETPARLGRFRGRLLIMGGGRRLWDDVARVHPWSGDVMAVNDVGQFWHGAVAHWATLHPEYLPGWRFYRQRHCYGEGKLPICHAPKVKEGVDQAWQLQRYGGTSGLFACWIGLMLGYSEIVLAGLPMDNGGHFFDPPWVGTDNEDRGIAIEWDEAVPLFAGRIKSLSGRTRDWLGAP